MSNEGTKRRSLGRGLSSLLGEVEAAVSDSMDNVAPQGLPSASTVRQISVSALVPGKFQPRHIFDEESLKALADSIREKGVLQPLLVRNLPDAPGTFEIIAGERRWRAAQQAQVHTIPVLVRDFTDQQAAEIALIENLQRQDLSALEEAEGYKRLQEEFSHTQEELSRAIGKSRSHIANMMRLLSLPDPVKNLVNDGSLSAGHARALLVATDPLATARRVISRGLSVRQTEALVQQESNSSNGKKAASLRPVPIKNVDTVALERSLEDVLGVRVSIDDKGSKGGTLSLTYQSLEQLDALIARLQQGSLVQGQKEQEEDESVYPQIHRSRSSVSI